jgi:hypothetical protein
VNAVRDELTNVSEAVLKDWAETFSAVTVLILLSFSYKNVVGVNGAGLLTN